MYLNELITALLSTTPCAELRDQNSPRSISMDIRGETLRTGSCGLLLVGGLQTPESNLQTRASEIRIQSSTT